MTSKERVTATLSHQEPDRVPTWEWFWPQFEEKWRREKGFSPNIDIYRYYEIDVRFLSPDIDPRIGGEVLLEKTSAFEIIRDGWGIVQRRLFDSYSPPQMQDFPIKDEQDLEAFHFDPPRDLRRYHSCIQQVAREKDSFAFFGRILGPYRTHWQMRGPLQSFFDMVEKPEFVERIVTKSMAFMTAAGVAQLQMIGDLLGVWIFDDVAYNNGMLFSPELYRQLYFPSLRMMCQVLKKNGAKFIVHHSDGDFRAIIPMLIEAGVDAIQPLEVRAGMDVLELKDMYGDKLSFIGNIDNTGTLRVGSREDIRKEVIHKLHAARGGGYIIGSSHSVGVDVPIANYEYFREIVRELGDYPLDLPEVV